MSITVDELLVHIRKQIDTLRTIEGDRTYYESFGDKKECERLERLLYEIEGIQMILQEPYYHRLGTSVLVYWQGEWQNGEIVNGYRTKDGVINVQLGTGEIVWFGESRHEEYLKEA